MNQAAFTLKGGTIIDGTGALAFRADVVVEGDRITHVGAPASRGSAIDVAGLVVAPGFVDIHSHDDWLLPLPDGPELVAPNVQQGITTVVAGNCGISPAPLGALFRRAAIERMPVVGRVSHGMRWQWHTVEEFFASLRSRGLPLNLCMFVGHSTLRATVMGDAQRPPTPAELAEMGEMLEEGLRHGAVGLSVGLEYFPGRYAPTSEIAALAETAKRHGALVAVHTRGISSLFNQGIDEAIEFATRSGCRLQISHVNPMGRPNWEAIDQLFRSVDDARLRGLDVGYDIVTYTAWTVSAMELLPHFVQEQGNDAVLALVATDSGRRRLRDLIEKSLPEWPPWIGETVTRNIPLEMGWENLVLAESGVPGFESERGETLATISEARRREAYDVYFDLLSASRGDARIVNDGYGGDFSDETPLHRLVKRGDAVPETDTAPVGGTGHELTLPLFFGTMPRFLGHFSRDLGLVTLEDAVHRITQLPAQRVGLRERGVIHEGAIADMTIFDLERISDQGSYLDPRPAAGIEHVIVNGAFVVRDRVYDSSSRSGRVLGRSG